MRTIFTFILLLSFTFSYAQETKATLSFRDGTEIQGFGRIKGHKIEFRLTIEDDYETWTDLMVAQINFELPYSNETYRYVDLDKKLQFKLLEVVEQGKFNLYAEHKKKTIYVTSSSPNMPIDMRLTEAPRKTIKTSYTIQNSKTGNYQKLTWPSRRKQLRDLLSDCPDFTERYDAGEFKEQTIEELVSYYNTFCSDDDKYQE